ncbi:MBL fold metallo-hydrolase [Blautia obeum]|uniref:MBL fold metallo-hydrolase n=1 Tax=Blautia obeum TaxID=40520 RepID=UPI002A8946C9|nr:MBL fold metallo-hydrolase [Lachnospiraceae bacterium]
MDIRRKTCKHLVRLVLLIMMLLCVSKNEVKASGDTKIHFISLYSTTDAILLESDGHYGMVDSGEDWDYPDGEIYELRDGVTQGIGYEQQVIHYLKELGVEKLDFYIATHSHSDHIGSGDEILRYFPTERLYIGEYKDEYIATEDRFWDNQYVYDCLIQAAQETGTQIITDLDLPENEQYRSFTMGEMQIDIMNYERDRDEQGNILPVPDENCNSLVTRVTAFDKVALLTADMDPWTREGAEYGDTVKIANQLIEQLWTEESEENEPEIRLDNNYDEEEYGEYNGVILSEQSEESGTENAVDETKVNTGRTIQLDLMKMNHHAINYNNTTYFLTSLNPKTVIVSGFESLYNAREKDCMPDAKMYATATDSAAVVARFSKEGIDTEYVKMTPGWMELDGSDYYFDENGRTYAGGKHYVIDGEEYCFNQQGAIETTSRWVQDGYNWRYWHADDMRFASSEWLGYQNNEYYFDNNGKMVTGWNWINKICYFFNSTGELVKDAWINGHYVDKEGKWIEKYSTAAWRISGNQWWYRCGNGSWLANEWATIDDVCYYFDTDGWMATGWKKIDGIWYYFKQDGSLAVNQWIDNCYVDDTGAWIEGYEENRWINSEGRWWYRHGDGSYTKLEFEEINGEWYYFDADGWMVTGWQLIHGEWYYFAGNGIMQKNTWIGEYYLNESGIWDQSQKRSYWVNSDGRWWYRHGDGSYTTSDFEQIDGEMYYFDADGWMVTGWKKVDDKWYYFDESGAMVRSAWIGSYYLKVDGTMAVDEWVEDGRYYVDLTGVCKID